jgi:hypothetical protein
MFVPDLTRAYYPDKEALAEDVVALLRSELEETAIRRYRVCPAAARNLRV